MQEPLAHGVDVLDRYLVYLLLGLVVQVHPLLGARHVVREVIVVQVLPGKQIVSVRSGIRNNGFEQRSPHVLQSVQQVT